MKLQLPAIVVFLFLTTGDSSPRLRPTLSASTKKPASLAGFLYFSLTFSRLNRSFSLHTPSFPSAFPTSVAYSNSK